MFSRVKASAKELKSTESLVLCAALIALYIILDGFATVKTQYFEITFSFLALAVIGYLFGVVPAFISAAAGDLISFFVFPRGAFHPGFTLTTILICVIFALFLYKQKVSLWRVILARLCINIFVNSTLTTLWVSQLVGKGFGVLFVSRAAKNLFALPIEIILLFFVLRAAEKILPKIKRS